MVSIGQIVYDLQIVKEIRASELELAVASSTPAMTTTPDLRETLPAITRSGIRQHLVGIDEVEEGR